MRVAVTRPPELAGALVALLEADGHEVVTCPLVAIEPIDGAPVDANAYDWVVVTSRNGAALLERRLRGRPRRLAAIGAGTAATLRERGWNVDLVPRVSTQEGLLAELPRPAGRVLHATAADARRLLVDELGAELLPLYRTTELRPERFPHADVVLLASGSAARAYAALDAEAPVVSIGPETTRVAIAAGLHVLREATRHDAAGLAAAVRALAAD